MRNPILKFLFLIFILFFVSDSFSQNDKAFHKKFKGKKRKIYKKTQSLLDDYINKDAFNKIAGYNKVNKIYIDTIIIDEKEKKANIHFSKPFSYLPFRPDNVDEIKMLIKKHLGRSFRDYQIQVFAFSLPIENFVPNAYRESIFPVDSLRMPKKRQSTQQLVRSIDKPFAITKGLNQRHVALWHSHGFYYEQSKERWQWQRARAFQTVEDLYPMSFVVPFLAPMLENAGANVFLPRERDIQSQMVIVDNDSHEDSLSYIEIHAENTEWQTGKEKGFGRYTKPLIDENPFRLGSYRFVESAPTETAKIEYIPNIPKDGNYAVYVSYKRDSTNVSDAKYTVNHNGQETCFQIDQKIGGATWIYLGTFYFPKGQDKNNSSVILSNKSYETGKITADAVRFGGGMGDTQRQGQISGYPRWMEAARYYMQFSGMPDTLVYILNENSDYRDDYQSRGEWANYLKGEPFGPNKETSTAGLGIPIDVSLAFHTDAGTTSDDRLIGTLLIYNSYAMDGFFPDSVSRMANRDYADILQSEIIRTTRAKYDGNWTRRGLWDKAYSEAYRPNMPSALIELLSHQNFADMRYGHEPQFKFDISRAIYKGILKYISYQNQCDYVVQPLPVSHFRIQKEDKTHLRLSWRAVSDALEPSAEAKQFVVYTKIDDGSFDNGILVNDTTTIINIENDKIYSFKIAAINEGGESFPSEVLSACIKSDNPKTLLIVNGFDRISAAHSFDDGAKAGFMDKIDMGVPYGYDISYIGSQYEYYRKSEWESDDNPGWGASFYDFENKIIPGNTFDFSFVHGKSIAKAGYSFVSSSDEAVRDGLMALNQFLMVDFLYGEERSDSIYKNQTGAKYQVLCEKMQDKLLEYIKQKGAVFISGAYIGTDLRSEQNDTFSKKVLKYKASSNYASKSGELYSITPQFKDVFEGLRFNTAYNEKIYTVEAPDAIEPTNKNAFTIARYKDSRMSAGIAYKNHYKIIALGFPFETIIEENKRDALMKEILRYLLSN